MTHCNHLGFNNLQNRNYSNLLNLEDLLATKSTTSPASTASFDSQVLENQQDNKSIRRAFRQNAALENHAMCWFGEVVGQRWSLDRSSISRGITMLRIAAESMGPRC